MIIYLDERIRFCIPSCLMGDAHLFFSLDLLSTIIGVIFSQVLTLSLMNHVDFAFRLQGLNLELE